MSDDPTIHVPGGGNHEVRAEVEVTREETPTKFDGQGNSDSDCREIAKWGRYWPEFAKWAGKPTPGVEDCTIDHVGTWHQRIVFLTVVHAYLIGTWLRRNRPRHGEVGAWIAELPFSHRTANDYMRIATALDGGELDFRSALRNHLSLRELLAELRGNRRHDRTLQERQHAADNASAAGMLPDPVFIRRGDHEVSCVEAEQLMAVLLEETELTPRELRVALDRAARHRAKARRRRALDAAVVRRPKLQR